MDNNQTNNAPADVGQTTTTAPVQNTQQNAANSNTGVNYDEIFKKLDSILEKRSEGIAKSALKDNGFEDAELKDILTQYRESKTAKSAEAETTIADLQAKLNAANAATQKVQLESEAYKQATALGIDNATIPYLIKMADLSNGMTKDGISADNIKAALEQVLKDIPSLKGTENKGTAGVQVGASASTAPNAGGNLFGFNFASVRGEKK